MPSLPHELLLAATVLLARLELGAGSSAAAHILQPRRRLPASPSGLSDSFFMPPNWLDMLEAAEAEDLAMKSQLVSREDALPGRTHKMRVSKTHYVLGTPMEGPWQEGLKRFVFANGCFWGSEKGIWRLPGGGIHSTAVGYAAGHTPNPTYQEACSGATAHAEAVQVIYDPSKISLVDILRWFWQSHDPTQGMGQGHDRGTQYRSGAYYADEDEKAIIEASRDAYQGALAKAGISRRITTQVASASDYTQLFYYAEDAHQQYLAKPNARPYCSAQPLVVHLPPYVEWAPSGIEEKFAPKLPEAFWEAHAPTPHCVVEAP